jgi:hypothetical protein
MKPNFNDYMCYGVWTLMFVLVGPIVLPVVGLIFGIGYVTKKILDFLGVDV